MNQYVEGRSAGFDEGMRQNKKPAQRIVGHLDMDAFFAAIEERNNPRFAGLPIAVGGDPKGGQGRGVLSTANYKAREYGLHSAMSVKKAWQLSQEAVRRGQPEVVFLSGGFDTYGTVSHNIMNIIKHHAPIMQKRSVDEAYFDLSHTGSYHNAASLCQTIKQQIKDKEELTASIGIGPNKLIAKIASHHDKPDGFTIVPASQVVSFLSPLPVRAVPGIGPKAASVLSQHNIYTIADLQAVPQSSLQRMFGKWGTAMYHKAHGRDASPIREHRIAKSIGRHRTFYQDTLDSQFIVDKLNSACEDVHNRLITEGFTRFRTVVLTVRFYDFTTRTRAHTLTRPTNSLPKLQHEIIRLLLPFLDRRENPQRKPIRLVGVRLEKFR